MNPPIDSPTPSATRALRAGWGCLLAAFLVATVQANEPAARETIIAPLQTLIAGTNCVALPVNFSGVVLWFNADHNELVLQTGTNILTVKMDLSAVTGLAPGREVRLTGVGTAGKGALNEALVDNDGLHSLTEQSGMIPLGRGREPLRVDWFNGPADATLVVEYAGPGLPRQPLPSTALFRTNPAAGAGAPDIVPGLNFRCFQGQWEWLPSWHQAIPFKEGVTTNCDIGVRTRPQYVGLEFRGYLNIDRPGNYTFWTRSDDGSRLYLGDAPLRIEPGDETTLPPAEKITPGQALAPGRDYFWAETEGTVTGAHVDPRRGLQIELTAGTGQMFIESDLATLSMPALFSRVQVTGLCRGVPAANGQNIAGRILVCQAGQLRKIGPGPIVGGDTVATTVAELRHLAASGQRTGGTLRLHGTVLATSASPGLFAFQDATGGTVVQMDPAEPTPPPGSEIQIAGSGVLDRDLLLVRNAAVVDNDGLHAPRDRSGAIYLTAGKHPIHLSWFNRTQDPALEVYYQGPGVPRQKIPASALVHPEFDSAGRLVWMTGLTFENFEGDWRQVPELAHLSPVAMGTAPDFTRTAALRAKKTGLEFTGFLAVPSDGQYYFTVNSGDGSLLFIDEAEPRLNILGTRPLPSSLPVASRQVLESGQSSPWSQTEGSVNFAAERDGSLYLEVNSGYGPITVEVVDATGAARRLLLGSRVKIQGFCEAAQTPGGQSVAGAMVTPGVAQIQIEELPHVFWSRYPIRTARQLASDEAASDAESIAHLRGRLAGPVRSGRLRLLDDTGAVDLEPAMPPPVGTNLVEVLGRLNRSETNLCLTCAVLRPLPSPSSATTNDLPVLTSIRQVKQLSREQAQRGYPVNLRGVITLVRGNQTGFILQDDTSAIDVWWTPYANTSLPRVGDYWEVTGETFANFSPNIRSSTAARLGTGTLPAPIRPAWDQLLNGSLDTLYVELQGIVTAVEADAVILLTRDGKIRVALSPVTPELLAPTLNALVRIRGCVVPVRDEASQAVRVGQIRLSNVSLNLDEPAPADPFATPLKHASELLQFDARAGSLQRIKLAGQVLHASPGEIFLRDGNSSVRLLPTQTPSLSAGDLVEAVGFPELGGPSPILREAVLRSTGIAPLPRPQMLANDALFAKGNDGRLVCVQARLIGLSGDENERLLELQNGSREFLAHLDHRAGALPHLIPGSLLFLTGVYSEQSAAPAQPFTAFDLLLNQPADIRVAELPPWWTLRRALIFAGGLAAISLAALVWIQSLRHQVEERSAELAAEIRRREQIQRQRDLDRERSRIAKDMHDHLGTSVTQVSLLAELAKKDALDTIKTTTHAEKISATALELGRTLDEIVWAVNPKNDSLDRFCDYVAVQAQELFELTDVLCRVDLPPEMPRHPLTAELRHNLFLAAREALNNVARHAAAREVWVRFQLAADRFQIAIVDDGKGFDPQANSGRRNGLQNMKRRLEEAGGRFEVVSEPGRGTRVILEIGLRQPLPGAANPPATAGLAAESSLASPPPGH